jgi:hypothetical protein
MLSQRLFSLVDDFGIVERGDNLSDQCPIWVKLRLGTLPVKQGAAAWVPRKCAWSKASEENIVVNIVVNSELESKLLAINLPLLELSCENPHCKK